MKKSAPLEHKIFAGFGVLALLAGLLNAFVYQNYLIGIAGAGVGLWLAYDNFQKIKAFNAGS